ncbi:MAG: type II CAAX endopeptidase family protein [Actinomycetaceae bacterium]|nr:type II CAAX endopeptidase family protein [Actinomycetaceae bacterium]
MSGVTEFVNPGGSAAAVNVRDYLRGARGQHYEGWKVFLSGVLILLHAEYLPRTPRGIVEFFFGSKSVEIARDAQFGPINPLSDPGAVLLFFLSIAIVLPIIAMVLLLVEKRDLGTLSSVKGRLRWGLFGKAVGLAAAIWGAHFLLRFFSGSPLAGLSSLIPQIVIILLAAPFHAIAIEYFFRGGTMQAFGAWGTPAWLAIIISTAFYSLIHIQYGVLAVISAAVMGLCACWLTIRTGGLEAAIGLHIVYNYALFGGALVFQSNPMVDQGSDWVSLVVLCLKILLFTAVADWWLRQEIIRCEGQQLMTGALKGPVGAFAEKPAPIAPAPTASETPNFPAAPNAAPTPSGPPIAPPIALMPPVQNEYGRGQNGRGHQ